jgi:hypothetical protein
MQAFENLSSRVLLQAGASCGGYRLSQQANDLLNILQSRVAPSWNLMQLSLALITQLVRLQRWQNVG